METVWDDISHPIKNHLQEFDKLNTSYTRVHLPVTTDIAHANKSETEEDTRLGGTRLFSTPLAPLRQTLKAHFLSIEI